jgi:hypothetical protein
LGCLGLDGSMLDLGFPHPIWNTSHCGFELLPGAITASGSLPHSSASSGTVEVGKGDTGWLWVFLSNDPFGRLVCIALVGFAADHLAGFVIVQGGDCVGGVVRWLGFGNGHVERVDCSSLLKRNVRGGHVVWRCSVGCRVVVSGLRWAWYVLVGFGVHCSSGLGMDKRKLGMM